MTINREIRIITILFFLFLQTNCSDLGRKKLNLQIIENEDVEIEWYDISEITTIHEFVDITNKRWHKTERIFEGNSGEIDGIYFKTDTIIIETCKNPIIYDLAAIKFGYNIIVKTR